MLPCVTVYMTSTDTRDMHKRKKQFLFSSAFLGYGMRWNTEIERKEYYNKNC